jgi:GNAT superfamily N-acetyltransferase
MGAEYKIVRYRPDLKRQVIELQAHLWSPNLSLNTDYFEWKYERNPYLKEPLIYLAMHNGKVIGMRGFMGSKWECGVPTQRFTCLCAEDMVISPEHRKRGLMSVIMTAAFKDPAVKDYDYVFSLSAALATLRSSLSMGWRSVGWMSPMPWQSPFDTLKSSVPRPIKKLLSFSERLYGFCSRRLFKLGRSSERGNLKRLKYSSAISIEDAPRCAAMAELVERIGGDGRIRHVRDSEYFQWRFQNPLSRYRYVYWSEGRLEGYLVLQQSNTEYLDADILNIVDWEASSAAIRERLLQVALKVFAKGAKPLIWSAGLSQATIALLRKNGFYSVKAPAGEAHFPPAILVRPIAAADLGGEWALGGRSLLDLANWDMRMLYSMDC